MLVATLQEKKLPEEMGTDGGSKGSTWLLKGKVKKVVNRAERLKNP